eukprot:789992-Heterocapsa_arctica.AAC.1
MRCQRHGGFPPHHALHGRNRRKRIHHCRKMNIHRALDRCACNYPGKHTGARSNLCRTWLPGARRYARVSGGNRRRTEDTQEDQLDHGTRSGRMGLGRVRRDLGLRRCPKMIRQLRGE